MRLAARDFKQPTGDVMILVGQYDSPFVRRVAISLRALGFAFERDTRSVFGDFDAMRAVNPLGRIPSLVLDDGTILIDSGAILDWLDLQVGPERALIPASGIARRVALQVIALATGAVEKFGAANYEEMIRPASRRWSEWIDRCLAQARGALDALERVEWDEAHLGQTQITSGCLLGYLALTRPGELSPSRHRRLTALWARLSTHPHFIATQVDAYSVPLG